MVAREPWTQRLRDHCLTRRFGEPAYQDVSDRRGGRTAWSTVAIVNGMSFSARYWYDGAYMEQAKEDAAEIALRNITGYVNLTVDPPPASHYQTVPIA